MTQPIISVAGLGKRYLVGHESTTRESYTALRDVVGRHVKSFGRKALDMMRGRQIVQGDDVEEFWALRDVSFDVGQGEVVGIIGRNGAGKSTLLKVLSRITEPTTGRVTLRGRVASLLEVGTGFHPELTGRENIFLNGAILGMTRVEIKQKFDEIVAFAEVERFLDTPVKRYSSGMYVRLAFAVAAHLEPEILVVDEVLAVGDAAFQKKCLGKMQDVAQGGRTVLFVSHNMAAIERLCSRALLLGGGRLEGHGDVGEMVARYSDQFQGGRVVVDAGDENAASVCTNVELSTADGQPTFTIRFGEPFSIASHWQGDHPQGLTLTYRLFDSLDRLIAVSNTTHGVELPVACDAFKAEYQVAMNPLSPGRYRYEVEAWLPPHTKLSGPSILEFEILELPYRDTFVHTARTNTVLSLPGEWGVSAQEACAGEQPRG